MSRLTLVPKLLNLQLQAGLLRSVTRTSQRNVIQRQSSLSLSTVSLEQSQSEILDKEGPIQEDSLDVATLELSPLLKRSLSSRNISSLFSIQKECFSHIVEGKDVVGRARTGTGKTLAFSLPVIERLERHPSSNRRFPRVLILAPTRELANQVDKEISQLCGSVYRNICVYGGSAYAPQENALRRGVDIVVGTPGRVQDMINKGHLNLSNIETLILDEADHMLDIGFAEDLKVIIESLRSQKAGNDNPIIGSTSKDNFQFLLFSATVPEWIKKAINTYLKPDHIYIDHVGSDTLKTNASILQLAIPTLRTQITPTISGLLQTHRTADGRCIIFCETKSACDSLSTELGSAKGIKARALHGDVSQASREHALNEFRKGNITCLIATDVAARGLDIANVELVIQTEPPKNTETFIHRSGRTGRAGNTGTCITLFEPSKRAEIDTIRKQAGVNFKIVPAPTPDTLQQTMLSEYVKLLNKVSSSKVQKLSSLLKSNLELINPELREDSLAALSAAFSTFSQSGSNVSKPRSLIDAREGYVTLVASGINRTSDIDDMLYSQLKISSSITSRLPSPVRNSSEIVFDIPSHAVDEVLSAAAEQSISLHKVTELPNIVLPSSSMPQNNRNSRSRGGFSQNRFPSGGNRPRNSFNQGARLESEFGTYSNRNSGSRSGSRDFGGKNRDRKPNSSSRRTSGDNRFDYKW